MHDQLGMIPEEQKQTFLNSRRQLTSNARESKEVTSFIQHTLHEWGMKKMLIQVSNTSLMFNKIMEEIRMLSMDSTTIHPGFHINGIPQLCEHGDSIGQTKEYNGVCSRKTTSKTTLRISLVLIWFGDSSYSNQRLDKIIGPATDHRDQSMKISSFFNTHYTRISLWNELSQASFYLPTLQVVV